MQEDRPPPPPEHSAEELKQLARQTNDPGERVWYLQWAKAFERLAEIGGRKRKGPTKPN